MLAGLLLLWLLLLALLWWATPGTTPPCARPCGCCPTCCDWCWATCSSPWTWFPDVLPVAGYADDTVLVAWVAPAFAGPGDEALTRHWPGTATGLTLVRRLAGLHHQHDSN
ncbi:hypothetical protein SAMN05661080_04421 [Modestobacter sp. DSM 44400]|uniref:YkvA family protein n=1 Tax=Modestobacter sp. DSM 44400 TaxID=1550230 RepID=UPI0008966DBB|nr:YkvA family protein [Modestobacter sp. DSM 44400]SDY72825.1 hypothetical protein SAMN05661080_04421 [Modestobacter sp. DSM 44400]